MYPNQKVFNPIKRNKKTSDNRLSFKSKEANKRSYLTGDKVFEVFSFDTRFGWIKTVDLPKYISGELQKYRAGEKEEEQKSEASASEKEDDHTVHNLPLEGRLARSVVEDIFNTALSHCIPRV